MKKIILLIGVLSMYNILLAQTILNNGFEAGLDTGGNSPKHWDYVIAKPNGQTTKNLAAGLAVHRDNSVTRSGKYSMKISVSDADNFIMAATQSCDINISSPQRIRIIAWIKTKDSKKGAGINCTQSNPKNKRLDYTSSRMQGTLVMNTKEWTKTTLEVLLHPETKQIEIWAHLYGAGTVWFDDISIEKIVNNKSATSPIVSKYVDTLIKKVKEYSYYKDSINWKLFSNQLKNLSKGMRSYKEAKLITYYVLGELRMHGDNHSGLMSKEEVKQFGAEDIQGRGREVTAKYLGDGIGYVSMPGFASMNDSIRVAFSTKTQELIKRIDTENNICGWVIDIRDDNGGSSPPMIAGLGPVLGEGVYAKDVSPRNDTYINMYKNGASYALENGKVIEVSITRVLKPYKLKNEKVAVAVLIGPNCGSSGESVAAAFIGRHDTKLFGQPTAGFTIGNEDFTLPDSSMMFIASGVQTDRYGKKYPDRIYPDVYVEETNDGINDITLRRAHEWLCSSDRCKKN